MARTSHKLLREGGQDGASDLLTIDREHCPRDKARVIGSKGDVTDCLDYSKVCEKCELPLLA